MICNSDDRFTHYNSVTISYLIEGILKARTTNLAEIVHHIDYDGLSSSLYKQFQRFFRKEMEIGGLSFYLVEDFINTLLSVFHKRLHLYLSIDRHNWKFGSKDNNLLAVHLFEPTTGIDFPVHVLDLNHAGNSSTFSRIKILNDISCFLEPYINASQIRVTVLGDREFIGNDWQEYLQLNFNSSVLRLKRSFTMDNGLTVAEVYNNLSINEIYEYTNDTYKIVIKRLPPIKGRRDSCLALISYDKSLSVRRILSIYKIRWGIERAFFNLESNGFNTRDTHLDKPKRIEMMVFILFACYYFSVITGYLNSLERRIPVKNHGYKAMSLFLSGRRFLCGLLNKYIISSQSTVIERLNYIFGSMYLLFKKNLIQNHAVKLGVL